MSIHSGLSYSDYAAYPALRSGMVRDFIKSPLLYKDRLDGIAPRKESRALEFGSASHMRIMEPARFAAEMIARPETYTNAKGETKPWNMNATVCQEAVAAARESGLIMLPQDDMSRLQMMQQRMPETVASIFGRGEAEVVVRSVLRGLECQVRVDWLYGVVFQEFKTIRDIDRIDQAIASYGYHLQFRFYQRVLDQHLGARSTGRIIFAETSAPYRWRVVELDLDYVAAADAAIDAALDGIAARRKSGCWDDPEDIHYLASPPSWMEVQDGELEESDAL